MENQYQFKQIKRNGETVTIHGTDMESLVNNVIVYRKNNGLGNTEYNSAYNEVRRQVSARKNAAAFRKSRPITREEVEKRNMKPKPKKRLSLAEIFHGAKAFVDIKKGNVVRQNEINRRAEICFKCQELSETTDCFGCGAGRRLVKHVQTLKQDTNAAFLIPEGNFKKRSGLEPISKFFCNICGCSAIALCVSMMRNIRDESDALNERRPDHCWMKRTSKNFIDDKS